MRDVTKKDLQITRVQKGEFVSSKTEQYKASLISRIYLFHQCHINFYQTQNLIFCIVCTYSATCHICICA